MAKKPVINTHANHIVEEHVNRCVMIFGEKVERNDES